MYTAVAIFVTIIAGFLIAGGIAILIYGLKTRLHERTHCTMSTTGIIKEKIWDETMQRNGPDVSYGNDMLCGLRLLVNINGQEYDVFNKEYDTAYYDYRVGQTVNIKINPDNPDEYYIVEKTPPAVTMYLFGAGFIVFGIILIRLFWFS